MVHEDRFAGIPEDQISFASDTSGPNDDAADSGKDAGHTGECSLE